MSWSVRVSPRAWPTGFSATSAISGGKVFVGSDYVEEYETARDAKQIDTQASLLCFREADGAHLWKYESPRLINKRVRQDWSGNPVSSTPYVVNKRLWFMTNRCEVVCLDTEGFRDGKNDGPYKDEANVKRDDADVIWKIDLIARLGVSPHEMANCSITGAGKLIFVCTSNGVDNGGLQVPAPDAPSFLAIERDTGRLVWSDKSPGKNILDGQWSSPSYAVLAKHPQVLFAGGDDWLRSFHPQGDAKGNPRPLWRFDCNPKKSKWFRPATPGKNSTRCNLIGMPVIAGDRVYVAVGQDGELGCAVGRLWCISPAKRGDVSPKLVYNRTDPSRPIPHKRTLACDTKRGDFLRPNPQSAAIWEYTGGDVNRNGVVEAEERLSGCTSSPVVTKDLVFIATTYGYLHCISAKTGRAHWI